MVYAINRHFVLTIVAQTRNEVFVQSRKDDPSVKERELALQSLDLSYHKYKEIKRNLEEGYQVSVRVYDHTTCIEHYNNSSTTTLRAFFSNLKKHANSGVHNANKKSSKLQFIIGLNGTLVITRFCCGSSLSQAMQAMSLEEVKRPGKAPPSPKQVARATHRRAASKSSLGLPSLDSDEWETYVMPSPPSGSG